MCAATLLPNARGGTRGQTACANASHYERKMGRLRKTMASLRIIGDDLHPDEITSLLRCAPTASQSKGDVLVGKKGGRSRIAAFGSWSLKASAEEPGNLDTQVTWLLAATTGDPDVWQSIAARYKIDLFCGLFMAQWNDGESMSAASLLALGSRHIQLDLDIYGAAVGEPDESGEMSNVRL
jgi:hypothetical protein